MLVLLVDSYNIGRESLASALSSKGFAVKDYQSMAAADSELANASVIVLQYLNDPSQTQSLSRITSDPSLAVKTIVLSDWLSNVDRILLEQVEIGGIMTKEHVFADLVHAIEQVGSGIGWSSGLSRKKRGARQTPALSPQEHRAAQFVLEGLSNKEIAERMRVSESYIKGLLQRVFLKSGVRSRAELIRLHFAAPNTAQRHAPRRSGLRGER